jgi:hypothetical protein
MTSGLGLLALGLFDVASAAAVSVHPKVSTSSSSSKMVSAGNEHAVKLPPVHFVDEDSLNARDSKSGLALRDEESFYYGHDSNNPIAKVTGRFADSKQRVINMDRFAGQLSHVDCKDPNLTLDFIKSADFEEAKESWKWVKEHKENKFLMVANYPGCGPENDRQPFQVTDIKYDEKKYKVFLEAHQVTWEEALPDWSVDADTKGLNKKAKLTRSLFNKDKTWSIPIEEDYSQQLFSEEFAGADLKLDCERCGYSGDLDIEVHAAGGSDLEKAEITMRPTSMSAYMDLALTAEGTLGDKYTADIPVFTMPLPGGFEVPYIRLGPNVNIKVGAAISEWKGKGKTTFGASLDVPGTSHVTMDLVNKDNSDFDGWVPQYHQKMPVASAEVSTTAEAYSRFSLDLSATIAGEGFEGSLILKAPTVKADLKADASTEGGVCGDAKMGVGANVHINMDLDAAAGYKDKTPFWEKNIVSKGHELLDKCISVGGGNPGNGTDPAVRRFAPYDLY